MAPNDESSVYYPHELGAIERSWCDWLLPADRPAYARVAEAMDGLLVIGIGRWGAGDFVLGHGDQHVDLEAPMEPVAAYGEIDFDDATSLSLSVHHPDDEARVELHLSGSALDDYMARTERSRWCYSYWTPGEPSPSGSEVPREIAIGEGLTLAIDAKRRVMWLHDASTLGNTLVPVTNFYNELMLLKGIRDPAIAHEHRRLFEHPDESGDDELRGAFRRYNVTWRKVDASRLETIATPVAKRADGLLARLTRSLRGGTRE